MNNSEAFEACDQENSFPWEDRTPMTQHECVFKKCCKKYKKKGRHCKKCPKL